MDILKRAILMLVSAAIALFVLGVGCATIDESGKLSSDAAGRLENTSSVVVVPTNEPNEVSIVRPTSAIPPVSPPPLEIHNSVVVVPTNESNEVSIVRPTSVRPPVSTTASEIHNFDSFPVMVVTSKIAIIGKVSGESEPRFVGERPMKLLRFEIDVEEVLSGSVDTPTIVLEVVDKLLPYGGDTTWTQPGERSVLFLEQNVFDPIDPRTHRLVNTRQSVYRIVGQDQLDDRNDDEFSLRVSAWSLTELRAQINSAKAQIERGEVQPQRHVPGRPFRPDDEPTDPRSQPGPEPSGPVR